MAAAVNRAIGYLNDAVVDFNGVVIVLSGIVYNASCCVKRSPCYLWGNVFITFLKVYILLNSTL